MDTTAAPFRNYLFSIAYRMLSSVQDAEDILQDTYLVWLSKDQSMVENPKNYLAKTVVNRSIKLLEQRQKQRANYFGTWLPEPLIQTNFEIEQTETISYSFLLLLEKLTPTERAVFLLHEVFDWKYETIAESFEFALANCRQLFHRAKNKIKSDKKRFQVNAKKREELTSIFMQVCKTGAIHELFEFLKEEVILYGDGGGKVLATVKPIFGKTKVMRFFKGVLPKMPKDVQFVVKMVNNAPTIITYHGQTIINVLLMELNDGGVANIYAVRNPDKLKHIDLLI